MTSIADMYQFVSSNVSWYNWLPSALTLKIAHIEFTGKLQKCESKNDKLSIRRKFEVN